MTNQTVKNSCEIKRNLHVNTFDKRRVVVNRLGKSRRVVGLNPRALLVINRLKYLVKIRADDGEHDAAHAYQAFIARHLVEGIMGEVTIGNAMHKTIGAVQMQPREHLLACHKCHVGRPCIGGFCNGSRLRRRFQGKSIDKSFLFGHVGMPSARNLHQTVTPMGVGIG